MINLTWMINLKYQERLQNCCTWVASQQDFESHHCSSFSQVVHQSLWQAMKICECVSKILRKLLSFVTLTSWIQGCNRPHLLCADLQTSTLQKMSHHNMEQSHLLVKPWNIRAPNLPLCATASIMSCLKSNRNNQKTWSPPLWVSISNALIAGKNSYKIAKKSPQQHFEGNLTMSVVITSWQLLRKC